MTTTTPDTMQIVFVVPDDTVEYVGVQLLSGELKRAGFKQITAFSFTSRNLERQIRRFPHTVLAFCLFTPFAQRCIARAWQLKRALPRQHITTVFGGPHPQFTPDMIYADGVDGICFGEAEAAMVEYVQRYDFAARRPATDVRNWWIKDAAGAVHKNPLRPVSRDLDALSFADMSLFPRSTFFRRGLRRFTFSRGCPFNCRYCLVAGYARAYHLTPAEYYRTRSVASAIAEIKQCVRQYGGTVVGFRDSILGIDLPWMEEFSAHYRREIGLPFYCNQEAQTLSARHAHLLRQAGCFLVQLGLESGNERVRGEYLHKYFSDERFVQAAGYVKEHGMRLGTYNMIGIPGGTLADDLQTLTFNQRVRTDLAECKIFSFYPGIEIYDEYVAKGAHPEQFAVRHNVYWSVISDSTVRRDLPQLLRLHCLFNIFVYYRAPRWLVRALISLPLRPLYKLAALLIVRINLHYRKMLVPPRAAVRKDRHGA